MTNRRRKQRIQSRRQNRADKLNTQMGGSPTSSPNLFFGLAQRAARLLSGKAAPVAIAVILIYLVIEFLRKLPG